MDVDLTLLQVEAMPEDSVSGYDETAYHNRLLAPYQNKSKYAAVRIFRSLTRSAPRTSTLWILCIIAVTEVSCQRTHRFVGLREANTQDCHIFLTACLTSRHFHRAYKL